MLFNSIDFAFFLPVVFLLYWFVTNKSLKAQNLLLLFASYFFYACWDWRFLFLLCFSTLLDYFTGLKIAGAQNLRMRKFWIWLSISVNLGFLGVFKYYNFFAQSFAEAISNVGFQVNPWTLKVILPVGISFYTFHGLSYVIDIYYQKIKPEKNLVDYSVFVSFFPLLVAGPIERATHLLPQIKKERTFDYAKAVDGLRQILWGLFKKIVIADQCAEYVNLIFNNYTDYSGTTLLLGAVLFAFQIYGDFSGYSDIALGTARLFGIELLRNFAFPYFSRDIAEFWRRWHISLSSWFRDYLYIPLGGSKGGKWTRIRNTFIIFIVSGFWHGANWTFIVWGLLNAIYIMPLIINNRNRLNTNNVAEGRIFPSLKEILEISFTFFITVIAWVFFRSLNIHQALNYHILLFKSLLTKSSFVETYNFILWNDGSSVYLFIFLFLIIEWFQRTKQHGLEISTKPLVIRWLVYIALIIVCLGYYLSDNQFIYFQF